PPAGGGRGVASWFGNPSPRWWGRGRGDGGKVPLLESLELPQQRVERWAVRRVEHEHLVAGPAEVVLPIGELPAHMPRVGAQDRRAAAGPASDEHAVGVEELLRVLRAVPGGLERQRQAALVVAEHLVAVSSP